MPVTRISASVDWSMNSGAGRWIGIRWLVTTGPRSSTGSPITLRIRPRVSGPTGIMIGPPVSTTSAPRTSPSVVSIAIVRTVFSPRCCATSRTRLRPALSTCSALRIDGNSPSKWTSTTAPMTWVIVPTILEAMIRSSPILQRLGPGDDLDQLLGDDGLARAIVVHRQPVDHIAGVAGGVVHRGHARALLARRVFEERGIDLHREVVGQQLGEDLLFRGLEFIDRRDAVAGRLLLGNLRRRERDQLLNRDDLGDRRAEAVEDDRADIKLAGLEQRQ